MKKFLSIKNVLLSFILILLFTSNTFADSSSIDILKSQFNNLLFTTLKADLNIDKDALLKDSELEKEINEYIDNAIIKGLTAPEFQEELNSEINSFKRENPNFSGLEISDEDNNKKSEYLNTAIEIILTKYDIKKEDLLSNNDFNKGVWSAIDEFEKSNASNEMSFKQYFQNKFNSYIELTLTEAKFSLHMIPLVVLSSLIVLSIYAIKSKKALIKK